MPSEQFLVAPLTPNNITSLLRLSTTWAPIEHSSPNKGEKWVDTSMAA
jgi:hypothetical protein